MSCAWNCRPPAPTYTLFPYRTARKLSVRDTNRHFLLANCRFPLGKSMFSHYCPSVSGTRADTQFLYPCITPITPEAPYPHGGSCTDLEVDRQYCSRLDPDRDSRSTASGALSDCSILRAQKLGCPVRARR